SRRDFQAALPTGASALAVSAAKAAAWVLGSNTSTSTLQAVVLDAAGKDRLTGTIETLDSGDIGSLRFTGLTLHWANAGQATSQPSCAGRRARVARGGRSSARTAEP